MASNSSTAQEEITTSNNSSTTSTTSMTTSNTIATTDTNTNSDSKLQAQPAPLIERLRLLAGELVAAAEQAEENKQLRQELAETQRALRAAHECIRKFCALQYQCVHGSPTAALPPPSSERPPQLEDAVVRVYGAGTRWVNGYYKLSETSHIRNDANGVALIPLFCMWLVLHDENGKRVEHNGQPISLRCEKEALHGRHVWNLVARPFGGGRIGDWYSSFDNPDGLCPPASGWKVNRGKHLDSEALDPPPTIELLPAFHSLNIIVSDW